MEIYMWRVLLEVRSSISLSLSNVPTPRVRLTANNFLETSSNSMLVSWVGTKRI